MATLIVETGAIVANANTYVTVAEADAYWADRNQSLWAALSPAEKEASLVIAAQYLEWNFDWLGSRINSTTQAMVWPRWLPDGLDSDLRFINSNVIPPRVKFAQIELAYLQSQGELQPNTDVGGLPIEVQLGPLSVKYSQSPQTYRSFAYVDQLLKLLVRDSSGISMKAVRA